MVQSGWHTFTWVFAKDGSVSVGEDAAWIDSLRTPGPCVGLEESADVWEIAANESGSSWQMWVAIGSAAGLVALLFLIAKKKYNTKLNDNADNAVMLPIVNN